MADKVVTFDRTERGKWVRIFDTSHRFFKFRYYYRGIRVPWLAWVMFS